MLVRPSLNPNVIPAKAGIQFERTLRYSTVTDLARFRGWSTSVPIATAVW